MLQKESIPSLFFLLSQALRVVACGRFDDPPYLKIAVPAIMSLADAMVMGGAEPARNPFSLHDILELVDAYMLIFAFESGKGRVCSARSRGCGGGECQLQLGYSRGNLVILCSRHGSMLLDDGVSARRSGSQGAKMPVDFIHK